MATTVADRVFIDTNVLVYASRPTAPQHAIARAALATIEASDRAPCVSPQVLREYLAVVTRQQATAPALPMATAVADIRRLMETLELADDGAGVIERLLQLLADHPGSGKQVHDANIVATMLTQGIRRLLTFNAKDFQRFADVIEIEALVGP